MKHYLLTDALLFLYFILFKCERINTLNKMLIYLNSIKKK